MNTNTLYTSGLKTLAGEIVKTRSSVSETEKASLAAYKTAFAWMTNTAVGGMEFNQALKKYTTFTGGVYPAHMDLLVYYRCIFSNVSGLKVGEYVSTDGLQLFVFREEAPQRFDVKKRFELGEVACCRFALAGKYYQNMLVEAESQVNKATAILEEHPPCGWYEAYQ